MWCKEASRKKASRKKATLKLKEKGTNKKCTIYIVHCSISEIKLYKTEFADKKYFEEGRRRSGEAHSDKFMTFMTNRAVFLKK